VAVRVLFIFIWLIPKRIPFIITNCLLIKIVRGELLSFFY